MRGFLTASQHALAAQAAPQDADAAPPDQRAATVAVGLMPVDYAPLPGSAEAAGEVQARLETLLGQRPGVALIGSKTMRRWSHTMRMSRIDRRELQAGAIAGADLLVLPRLVRDGGGFMTHLRLVDTATGKTLWEQARHSGDQEPTEALYEQLLQQIDGVPVRDDQAVDLALLIPDDVHGRTRRQDWRAEATRQRWADKLAALDAPLRVLDPHLSDFVSRGAIHQRMGLVDEQKHSPVVRSPIVIETRLDAPYTSRYAYEDAPYRLTLTVRDGDWQQVVRVKGTRQDASRLEAKALNQVLAIVAKRRGVEIEGEVAAGDERYWQARALMYEGHTGAALEHGTLYNNLATTDGEELIRNIVAAVEALPGSMEPLAPLGQMIDSHGLSYVGVAQDHPYRRLTDLVVKHYSDLPVSGRAVMSLTNRVYDRSKHKLSEGDPALLEQALGLARQTADAALMGQPAAHPNVLYLLLHVDEGPLALDAAVAIAWQRQSLGDWTLLSRIACEAIDVDDMDLAYRAYAAQVTLFPGYFAEGSMRQKERLVKLKADQERGRDWEALAPGLLQGKGRLIQPSQDAQREQAQAYEALKDESQWQLIVDKALRALREQPPLLSCSTYQWGPVQSYLYALGQLNDEQVYMDALRGVLYGELPEINGGWEGSVVMRHNARSVRFAAAEYLVRRMIKQRRFADILDHPMLGTRMYYQAYYRSEWELYTYAGRPQRAIEAVVSEDELIRAYLYAGKVQEALDQPLDRKNGERESYAKAALLAKDWQAYDRAVGYIRKSKQKQVMFLVEQVQLMRSSTNALEAWVDGYRAEFFGDTDAAIEAYQACAINHRNTFAGAEAMFRVGELMLLDAGVEDKSAFWFSEAAVVYGQLVDGRGGDALKAWCRYRIGQVAYLVDGDRDAAQQAWQAGSGGDGVGKRLCGWALHSVSEDPPVTRVGNARDSEAKRVVDVDIDKDLIYMNLDKRYFTKDIDAYVYGPLGMDFAPFESYGDDHTVDWWSVYLWYKFNDIRPGFALVYVSTPESSDTVWCRVRGGAD